MTGLERFYVSLKRSSALTSCFAACLAGSGDSTFAGHALALMHIPVMRPNSEPGLGELLRHLSELVDAGAAAAYRRAGIDYRPRYTPIVRHIGAHTATVTEITAAMSITQGAVSQTVKLMQADGLIVRQKGADTRSSTLRLSPMGLEILNLLERQWASTFKAIEQLETEIGIPLRQALMGAIAALDEKDFAERISEKLDQSHDNDR